jgi:hypothetical protein
MVLAVGIAGIVAAMAYATGMSLAMSGDGGDQWPEE